MDLNGTGTTEKSELKLESAKQDPELQVYFKSLNRIEDTIKFMEKNILGSGKKDPEVKNSPPKQPQRTNFLDEELFFFKNDPPKDEKPSNLEPKIDE